MESGATDSAFLRSVYKSELPFVWNYMKKLGVPDKDLEDISHDVFVAMFRSIREYDPKRSMRAWLAGIAYRIASDYRRKAGRRQTEPIDDAVFEVPAEAPGPEHKLGEKQTRKILFDALDALPFERRDVVVLHDLEGYSMPEIAEIMSAPINTLYSRLRLGREQLRTTLRQTVPEVSKA